MCLFASQKYNNLLVPEEAKARTTVMQLISSHNPWVNPYDIEELKGVIKMTDAEIYYIASVVLELETIKQQRALLDILHVKCEEETMYRFMSYFPPESLNEMMLSC